MRKIIHIDMDAFYAAVEQRDNPALRGKAIAIGRSAEERGVIATASYEARKFGVRSAISTSEALRRCPHLILVKPDFEKYKFISSQLYSIYSRWTDIIETVALDECYLDVSIHKSATMAAEEMKDSIKRELKLTASAGVSVNKLIAKICSDINKPDGLYVVPPEKVEEFIADIPLKDINGVGREMLKKIKSLGLGGTCKDLQALPFLKMVEYFGIFGERLYYYVRGIDERPVVSDRESKSIGTENTFQKDIYDREAIYSILYDQLKEVIERANEKKLKFKTITLKIKFKNFKQITRSKTFDFYTDDFLISYKFLSELMSDIDINSGVRLSGVTLANFEHNDGQYDLF